MQCLRNAFSLGPEMDSKQKCMKVTFLVVNVILGILLLNYIVTSTKVLNLSHWHRTIGWIRRDVVIGFVFYFLFYFILICVGCCLLAKKFRTKKCHNIVICFYALLMFLFGFVGMAF